MSSAAEDDVETASAAMPPVSAANRRDLGGMARGVKPVVDRRSDSSSLDGWVAGAVMSGDQQQHAISAVDRRFERAVDRTPGLVEAHAVQVEDAVGLDGARAEPPVPA
jgi:hypothetical protein